jgi:SAM-dependent methyltransferase
MGLENLPSGGTEQATADPDTAPLIDRSSAAAPGHAVVIVAIVNDEHLALCSSPEWASFVENELLPWVLDGHQLGDDLLEVGPGPGLTTDILRRHAARLAAAELDPGLAGRLATRLAGSNVAVVRADAARLPFAAGCFSAAACLTMLHHIPTVRQQDAALAEIARVLRPGGILVGSDGLDTPERRRVHQGDIFVPVEPGILAQRLRTAGFADASVQVAGDRVRFAAAVAS